MPRFDGSNRQASLTESAANGRLIAAAPEMYDLLEAILSDWEEGWQGDEPRELGDLELRVQGLITTINPDRYRPQPDSEPDYSLNPGPF